MLDLDPEARAVLVQQAKRELRRHQRALRQALPAASVQARSARVCERLIGLDSYRSARSIALFWPIVERNEVDLRPVDQNAREGGKRVYYPFMDATERGYRTGFREACDSGLLTERGRGFFEPPLDAPEAARGDIDLVIVPALAVALTGHRVGYGAGFYDATLPDVCPPARSVVVAFAFQLLAELPTQAHDFACDFVITDERVSAAER